MEVNGRRLPAQRQGGRRNTASVQHRENDADWQPAAQRHKEAGEQHLQSTSGNRQDFVVNGDRRQSEADRGCAMMLALPFPGPPSTGPRPDILPVVLVRQQPAVGEAAHCGDGDNADTGQRGRHDCGDRQLLYAPAASGDLLCRRQRPLEGVRRLHRSRSCGSGGAMRYRDTSTLTIVKVTWRR